MRLNLTTELKVITIWISRELPMFNFLRLDILCDRIGPPSEKLWAFEFLENFRCSISCVSIYYAHESDLRVKSYKHLNFSRASVVQFRASRHIMRLNRTSVWKVMTIYTAQEIPYSISNSQYIVRLNWTSEWKLMTIWIAQELPLFNFEHLYMSCTWIGLPSKKLWPFELLKSFHCSISSDSLYYAPELDLRVKSYENLTFSRASVVQFCASRYIMRLNRTSEWKVMTI